MRTLCGWALLLVVSLVLLLCALASIAIRWLILAPDILRCVSSMTRDSFLFPEQDQMSSSALSRQARARYRRKVQVQIADMKPEDEIGRIALAPVTWKGPGREKMVRLSKGRMYDRRPFRFYVHIYNFLRLHTLLLLQKRTRNLTPLPNRRPPPHQHPRH
jgi:hypothetical protein